jgi:transcriptional regulator
MAGDLYTGTLELLVLQALSQDTMHGYRIAHWIRDRSRGVLDVEQGALYPALHRLNRKELVRGEWGETDQGRRARFYHLTEKGRKALANETARWHEHAGAVRAILATGE